eukprot:GHUV01022001.1.p1 GENE.GHUV01022001.1~~GHUV01022001.1.p1  ORF type:complete len:237 (-),score=18.73 GHUV01022001.1:627-1337(-)
MCRINRGSGMMAGSQAQVARTWLQASMQTPAGPNLSTCTPPHRHCPVPFTCTQLYRHKPCTSSCTQSLQRYSPAPAAPPVDSSCTPSKPLTCTTAHAAAIKQPMPPIEVHAEAQHTSIYGLMLCPTRGGMRLITVPTCQRNKASTIISGPLLDPDLPKLAQSLMTQKSCCSNHPDDRNERPSSNHDQNTCILSKLEASALCLSRNCAVQTTEHAPTVDILPSIGTEHDVSVDSQLS